jgi:hypothetical protein
MASFLAALAIRMNFPDRSDQSQASVSGRRNKDIILLLMQRDKSCLEHS